MNIALILAGGTGSRLHSEVPKQYLELKGKPILFHTLEVFERSKCIDAIYVIVSKDNKDLFEKFNKQFVITKLCGMILGGQTSHESLLNGVRELSSLYTSDDIVVVHESVRPFISEGHICEGINVCQKKGNAISVITGNEAILYSEDHISSKKGFMRDNVYFAQMPQFFRLGTLVEAFNRASEQGIKSQSLNTLMLDVGMTPLFFTAGNNYNLKLTTPEDLIFFEYMLEKQNY